MLIFGHVGITIGLAKMIERAIRRTAKKDKFLNVHYGLVALGSMLPDIIDKPLGHIFLRESLNYGRIISHTLVFSALLWLIALAALRRGVRWPLAISFGSLVHLILDEMWQIPQTLLWPLYGWSFPHSSQNFLLGVFYSIYRPEVYIPEIAGAAILLLFWLDCRRGERPGALEKIRSEAGIE